MAAKFSYCCWHCVLVIPSISSSVLLTPTTHFVYFLDLQDLNSPVRHLPYLYCHVLRDERPMDAYPPLLLLYQVALQLFSQKQNIIRPLCKTLIIIQLMHVDVTVQLEEGSTDFAVAAVAVDVHPHGHAVQLQERRELLVLVF